MLELKLGKMTSREVAQWMGVSYNTYKNHISKYLELLSPFCEFDVVYGGIIIKEIYIPQYEKNLNIKDKEVYLTEIQSCVERQEGLSTIAGMSRKLVRAGIYNNVNTAYRRLTRAGVDLFGITKELISHGEKGTREYIWAIKLDDYNGYRLMTPEEDKRFDEIIIACYSANPDKVRKAELLEDSLRKKEISPDEYFESKDRLQLDTFKDCIFKFKEETGCMIVRCSKHDLIEYVNLEKDSE